MAKIKNLENRNKYKLKQNSDFFNISNIIKFNSFTDETFYRYLHSQSIGKYFTNRLTDENNPLEKLLSLISGLSVSLLIINLPINL